MATTGAVRARRFACGHTGSLRGRPPSGGMCPRCRPTRQRLTHSFDCARCAKPSRSSTPGIDRCSGCRQFEARHADALERQFTCVDCGDVKRLRKDSDGVRCAVCTNKAKVREQAAEDRAAREGAKSAHRAEAAERRHQLAKERRARWRAKRKAERDAVMAERRAAKEAAMTERAKATEGRKAARMEAAKVAREARAAKGSPTFVCGGKCARTLRRNAMTREDGLCTRCAQGRDAVRMCACGKRYVPIGGLKCGPCATRVKRAREVEAANRAPVIDYAPPLLTSTVRPAELAVSVHGRSNGGWLGVATFRPRAEPDLQRILTPVLASAHGNGMRVRMRGEAREAMQKRETTGVA